ncbi:hypothetical protein DKX38_012937 [Salix brachista]|uniref:Uncharacterized protein n=1 Tax=Salix brachista TaxID=2182728 RepID=A0A5N5LPT0_9ROSI|nr:hypothetical protein DKX38_012937 [Salix brachista]
MDLNMRPEGPCCSTAFMWDQHYMQLPRRKKHVVFTENGEMGEFLLSTGRVDSMLCLRSDQSFADQSLFRCLFDLEHVCLELYIKTLIR